MISYTLTLIVVTYNGWLILSVLIGVGLGYAATLQLEDIQPDGDGDEDDIEEE